MANETIAQVMTTSPRKVKSRRPDTPEEAKARFLVAAARLSPGRVIRNAPWQSVGLALGTGFLLGYSQSLRQDLYGLGRYSLKAMINVITRLWPRPLAKPITATITVEDKAHLSS